MRILESTETTPSLHATQAIAEVATSKDSHSLIALRAKLADEVVIPFVE